MNELVHFLFRQSENTRAVLYAFTGQFLIYYMADKMLARRHSRIPLYICLIIKTLMVYPTELYFLAHPELNAAESLGFFIYSSWRDTIVTGLSLWTYSRNNGKTGLIWPRAYDRILEKNRETAENLQRQIREQTEQLSRQAQEGERPESGQMHVYLKELQEEAENLQISGVYCGNYLLDAVLCIEQQMLEKLGYRADFRCVNVPEHMEDTATLPQIVELVCEEWMEQKKGRNTHAGGGNSANDNICHLQITAARGQILITANIPGKWNRARKKLLKEFLAVREGVFADNKESGKRPDGGQACTILISIAPDGVSR